MFIMKASIKNFFFILFNLIFISKTSHAYFDPGTGAYIVQAIIAFFAAIVFYLGYPIIILKKIVKKIKQKFSKKNK